MTDFLTYAPAFSPAVVKAKKRMVKSRRVLKQRGAQKREFPRKRGCRFRIGYRDLPFDFSDFVQFLFHVHLSRYFA